MQIPMRSVSASCFLRSNPAVLPLPSRGPPHDEGIWRVREAEAASSRKRTVHCGVREETLLGEKRHVHSHWMWRWSLKSPGSVCVDAQETWSELTFAKCSLLCRMGSRLGKSHVYQSLEVAEIDIEDQTMDWGYSAGLRIGRLEVEGKSKRGGQGFLLTPTLSWLVTFSAESSWKGRGLEEDQIHRPVWGS